MDLPDTFRLPDDGTFPNSRFPLLVYDEALPDAPDRAAAFEATFGENGWRGAWRNGVFSYHHYHSTAHEVLGIARGTARLRLGGPGGVLVQASPGTVIVIPAGVAHRNEGSSADFLVVGATDGGRNWDIRTGAPGEREATLPSIEGVPIPKADPLAGAGGPLTRLWRP